MDVGAACVVRRVDEKGLAMADEWVTYHDRPTMTDARMLLAFTGWMDGGEVSTGSLEFLIEQLGAQPVAEINAGDSYISQLPGSMEMSAIVRPHVEIKGGLVEAFHVPANTVYADPANRLLLLLGPEPNLHWHAYAESIFAIGRTFSVREYLFVGSVAGAVPHTREPRFVGTVSQPALLAGLAQHGVRPLDYEGPASIASYLVGLAAERGLDMTCMVAEIPAYVQGRNLRGVEAVIRKASAVLGLRLSLDELRGLSDALERKLSELVEEHEDLAKLIARLEHDYDNEVFDTQMGDLKDWLEQRGIRVD